MLCTVLMARSGKPWSQNIRARNAAATTRWSYRKRMVCERFDRAVDAIVRAGAAVDDAARPGIDDEEHHRLFMLLLRAATASRMREEDFSRQQEIAATLTEDDISDRAAVARGAT